MNYFCLWFVGKVFCPVRRAPYGKNQDSIQILTTFILPFDKIDKVWKCNQFLGEKKKEKGEREKFDDEREGINFRSSVNNAFAGPMTRTRMFRDFVRKFRTSCAEFSRSRYVGMNSRFESITFWFLANVHTLLSINVKLVAVREMQILINSFFENKLGLLADYIYFKLIKKLINWKIFTLIFLLIVIECNGC